MEARDLEGEVFGNWRKREAGASKTVERDLEGWRDNDEGFGFVMERGPGVQGLQRGTRAGMCSVSTKQSGSESYGGSKYLKPSGSRSWLLSTLTLGSRKMQAV